MAFRARVCSVLACLMHFAGATQKLSLGFQSAKAMKAHLVEGHSKSSAALLSSEFPIPPPELRKGDRAKITESEYRENAIGLVNAIDTLAAVAKIMKETRGEQDWAKTKLREKVGVSYLKGKNIMDYGCGPGRMLIGMKLAGIEYGQYVGVDVEEASIKWLNTSLPDAKNKYVWIDIANERYNPNGKQYDPEHPVQQLESIGANMDVIHLRSVFSHMRATDIFNHLQGLKSNLREDGLLIVSLFVRNDVPREVENPNDEGDTPLHAVEINKADFESAVAKAGYYALLETTAMGQQTYVLTPGAMQHPLIDQTLMVGKLKQQGQPTDAPYNVFDMRDHPKNRDHEGDCKWRCGSDSRCARYEFDAITLICNLFEESKDHLSHGTPFDVFDMRDHKKNRNNEGDCKWRCDHDYRCVRYEFDASTLFCKLFKKSKDDSDQGVPAFDVFDMLVHKKNRNNEGDCKWRCHNNYRCARYEYDADTLFCKLFGKSENDSHQSAPFDAFDMRDHPKNRDYEGDCKWRCDNTDRCARYEFDATTLICRMFEKYHLNQDDKDTSGEDEKDEQVLVEKKSKSGFEHNSEKDGKDDSDDKKSKKGFKHETENDDKEISDNNANDDNGNKKSKQGLKPNSDEDGKKTGKDHAAKRSPDVVSDKHGKHSKNGKSENKKNNEEPEAVVEDE